MTCIAIPPCSNSSPCGASARQMREEAPNSHGKGGMPPPTRARRGVRLRFAAFSTYGGGGTSDDADKNRDCSRRASVLSSVARRTADSARKGKKLNGPTLQRARVVYPVRWRCRGWGDSYSGRGALLALARGIRIRGKARQVSRERREPASELGAVPGADGRRTSDPLRLWAAGDFGHVGVNADFRMPACSRCDLRQRGGAKQTRARLGRSCRARADAESRAQQQHLVAL